MRTLRSLSLKSLRQIEEEMEAADDAEFLINDLVHAGMTTILGQAWLGKTFLALMITHSLTTSEPIFGRAVNGQPRQVAWLSTDARGERSITRRARTMGLDLDHVFAQSFYTPSGPDEWVDIVHDLVDLRVGAVVIDNTSDIAEDANAPRETKLVTDGLRRMIDADIAVVNIHHDGGSRRKPEFGSSLWGKMTRLRLHLTGDPLVSPGPRGLMSQPNEGAIRKLVLAFDPEQNPVFTVVTEGAACEPATGETGRSQRRASPQDRLAAMKAGGGWATQTEIARDLEITQQQVSRVLKSTGHVLRDGSVVPRLEAVP